MVDARPWCTVEPRGTRLDADEPRPTPQARLGSHRQAVGGRPDVVEARTGWGGHGWVSPPAAAGTRAEPARRGPRAGGPRGRRALRRRFGGRANGVRWAVVMACAAISLAAAPAAGASTGDTVALAKRYAPVVRLVAQDAECGPGESYMPIDVALLFGQPTVALRGPWRQRDLVKIAPTARDLGGGLYEYHLDFPGDALDPGCDYERWARRVSEGHDPTAYAHVATDPEHAGRLALQYWLFYAYNHWNNLHEG